ncbi:MAG: hypothetical protein M1828_007522 [Chrysothrix sp. TS-e1954]|nr:MAG: hypothetical protein M1828_007522 [Chrysothrix sp. TS-e1954]
MAAEQTGDHAPTVVGVTILMLVISILAIALRITSRLTSAKIRLWWDDYLALAAMPFLIVLDALAFYWVSVGFGKPIREAHATPGRIMVVLFVVDLIYNIGLTLIKLSALLFYARCFKAVKAFNIALWVGAGLVIAWLITFVFMAIFTCVPVQKSWEQKTPGHCLKTVDTFYGTTLTNVFIDLYILILPLPLLWNLQTAGRRKAALFVVFILGYCVIGVSIARLVTSVNIGEIKDPTWQLAVPMTLLISEPAIALLSVSVPAMYDLFKRVSVDAPSLFSRSGGGASSRKTNHSDEVKLHPGKDSPEVSQTRSDYS